MTYEFFGDYIGVFLLFAATFSGCSCFYVRGKKSGYLSGYEDGYKKGLSDAIEDERGKAIIEMLRSNVAKKIEEKIRAECRETQESPRQ
ncbi:MAG TPA: hypothetical protein VHS80_13230 [Chthoniobacterales bacterium]|nr:hypothetical protein [Chthoniobacterales bacterium]